MIEKVNPSHPDKVADRVAGALVDLAYRKSNNPKIAVEVLLGHKKAFIIIETSEEITYEETEGIVKRIGGDLSLELVVVPQDKELAKNQDGSIKCGDNGIFKGMPLSENEKYLGKVARDIYKKYPSDGKYIYDGNKLIICQSKALTEDLEQEYKGATINPLGYWDGGLDVDSGATNRKLGSDMGRSVTGGGLHGKDLSKADVSINIYAFLKAQELNEEVNLAVAIGDKYVDNKPYSEIVRIAKDYIDSIGGFEEFAKWGLF